MPIDPKMVVWDQPNAGSTIDPRGIAWDAPSPRPPSSSPAPVEHDPTGSFGQNLAAGLGQFLTKLATGGKQLVDDSAAWVHDQVQDSPVGLAIDSVDRRLGFKSPQQIQADGRAAEAERRRLDAPLDATAGGKVGNATGALTLGALVPGSSLIQAAGTGAALGALEPVAAGGERAGNISTGAIGGAAGSAVTKGLARVIRPNTNPAVTKLLNEGITPTPGHVLGGAAARIEDAMTSVPVLGDAIRAGQNRATAELNAAAINRTLVPIGLQLPKGLTGREAIQYADDALGAAYNRLLPKLTVKMDPQFAGDVSQLRNMVRTGTIAPAEADQFERILQNGVLGKLRGQGVMTGQTLKQVESDLGRLASMYQRDPSADKRLLGDAVLELQATVRDLVQRSNPGLADELRQINSGWANLVRVRKAAAATGAEDGVFSVGQLQSAVRAADRSRDKSAFAKGTALMQDLSDPARQVLGSKVPDSGTPSRLMTAAAGAGGSLGFLFAPKALATTAAPMLAYTPLGQRVAAALLAQRPASADQLAEGVRALAPYMTALGGAAAAQVGK